MLTRLLDIQPSVFREIVLFTVSDSDFSAPLRDFISLSLVCRAAYHTLTENSAPLYFNIFSDIFDVFHPLNRLGTAVVQEYAKDELKRRFTALKILRRGDLDDPHLTEAFWIAYMMFKDSSQGQKNVKHLLATGIRDLLNSFLRQYLYRGSETNHGWPIPNEQNSLAVALLWLSTSLRTSISSLAVIDLLNIAKRNPYSGNQGTARRDRTTFATSCVRRVPGLFLFVFLIRFNSDGVIVSHL